MYYLFLYFIRNIVAKIGKTTLCIAILLVFFSKINKIRELKEFVVVFLFYISWMMFNNLTTEHVFVYVGVDLGGRRIIKN